MIDFSFVAAKGDYVRYYSKQMVLIKMHKIFYISAAYPLCLSITPVHVQEPGLILDPSPASLKIFLSHNVQRLVK